MDSTHKTIIDIATVSQRLVNTFDRCIGHKTAETFRLDKIVVGSRTILEALNKVSLLRDGNVDDRLVDWLNSEEPRVCLRTLNQMNEILDKKLEYGVKSFFGASQTARAQDKSSEAIRLFHMRKSYFHFLLTVDVWDRENLSQRQPFSPDVLQVNQVLRNRQAFAPATSYGGMNPSNQSSAARTSETSTVEGRQGVNSEKLNSVLGWLNAHSPRDAHERTILLRQPDTCTWLPNMPQYKTWRGTGNSFLWLQGRAGSGKSVLTASIIEALKTTLRDDESLLFFYCDFRNERSTSTVEVMRSILSQSLRQFRRRAVNPGDVISELIEEMDDGTSTINNAMLLTRHVSSAAKQFPQQPFLVIDALDECNDVELLLEVLMELQRAGIRMFLTSRPLQVIKEAFLGLPTISMDVMRHLVLVDIKLHSRRELDSHRRLRLLDSNLKNQIYFALCEKADGMFRWVQCQLDSLKRCVTAERIREALKNLPKDLNATYERILLQIDEEEEGKVVRRTLDWLLFAFVPLQLCQVMEILSIDLNQRVVNHDSRPVHGPALLDALGSLVMYDEKTDVVVLSHFSVKEYLTARSTLIKHPTYQFNQRDVHTRLTLLCICYITIYLDQNQRSSGSAAVTHGPWSHHDNKDLIGSYLIGHHISSPSESHPFLEYVLPHGFRHLSYVKWRVPAVFHALRVLQTAVQRHPLEWEGLCERSYGVLWPTLEHDFVLYILIAFAPDTLLRLFIGRAKLHPKDGTNPLIYAAHFQKINHAKILLSRGVSLIQSGWDIGDRSQTLPLEVALKHGDRAIVDLFLDAGSPVPQELFLTTLERKGCPFPVCNVTELLKTDEFVEWSVGSLDEELPLRALDPMRYHFGSYPSQRDMDFIRWRLIQVGCDPSTRFNETSLRGAARMGHVSTIKDILLLNIPLPPSIILDASINPNPTMISYLLSLGCRVDVASPEGDTPLHLVINSRATLATESDRLKSIQALTCAGCSPSARNRAGDTPLHLAARRGYVSIVECLLLLPLPTDILLAGSTSLSNTVSTIRLLVEKGAYVHAMAANGNTALHRLLNNRSDDEIDCLECIQILVNAGCEPSLSNARGETAIDVAVKNGHFRVVEYFLSMNLLWSPSILLSVSASGASSNATSMFKFLVSKGADVHATHRNGDTLLHLAIRDLWEPMCLKRIQTLINVGCDAQARNSAGKTPFHIAASRGLITVMEYLISLGVPVPPDVMLTQFEELGISCQSIYFLLKHGGDLHTIAANGDTLLHLAVSLDTEHDALELTRHLVQAGCNPCALNSSQETPLHIAAQHACITILEYLLSLNLSIPSDILLSASKGGEDSKRVQTIRYLIDKGAKGTVATIDGNTALHLFLAQGEEEDCLEGLEILIAAGCDPLSQNSAGEISLHAAARSGSTTMLQYLLSQNVPVPHDILLASAPSTIRFLLEKGIGLPSTARADGDMESVCRTLRSLGTDDSCQAFVGLLIDLGWNFSSRNPTGETPINVAVERGRILTVKHLRSHNASLPSDILLAAMASFDFGCTHSVVLPLVRLLIREGANVNTSNSNGDTPLHLALRCDSILGLEVDTVSDHLRSWELVEALLDSGSANLSVRNADGQTPFDIAEANGHSFNENFLRLVQKSSLVRS